VPSIAATDLVRMRAALLFDGPERPRKLSRFWALLLLSAVIASAGVMADSTATVIGAMIVAPLMTPILGIVLSVVTADHRNLAWCAVLVVTGAASVVAVGYLIGTVAAVDVVSSTSSQVAGRVSPRLIDLIAALATGAVGAFALVREDVSDTLPGVAIAISLVPPLAVVGLTLEAGAGSQSAGALLLFATNVAAILLSGVVVMALYRVPRWARVSTDVRRGRAPVVVIVASVAALAVPLVGQSVTVTRDSLTQTEVADVAGTWAGAAGWRVEGVEREADAFLVEAAGPLPAPEPDALRAALDAAGLDSTDVRLEMIPAERVDLPAR
jgi:uncharacterized hydrophobic protein (TIGR00271 family)